MTYPTVPVYPSTQGGDEGVLEISVTGTSSNKSISVSSDNIGVIPVAPSGESAVFTTSGTMKTIAIPFHVYGVQQGEIVDFHVKIDAEGEDIPDEDIRFIILKEE